MISRNAKIDLRKARKLHLKGIEIIAKPLIDDLEQRLRFDDEQKKLFPKGFLASFGDKP